MKKRPAAGSERSSVGRGRPPEHSQFRPGVSGNPNGRPKGRKNNRTIVTSVLLEPISVTDKGRSRKMPAVEALLRVQRQNALQGDEKAARVLLTEWNRVNGIEPESQNDAPPTPGEIETIFEALKHRARGPDAAPVGDPDPDSESDPER